MASVRRLIAATPGFQRIKVRLRIETTQRCWSGGTHLRITLSGSASPIGIRNGVPLCTASISMSRFRWWSFTQSQFSSVWSLDFWF